MKKIEEKYNANGQSSLEKLEETEDEDMNHTYTNLVKI